MKIHNLCVLQFVELFYHGSNIRTFFESCGVADLIATCSAGRNRKICEAFVKTGKVSKLNLMKNGTSLGAKSHFLIPKVHHSLQYKTIYMFIYLTKSKISRNKISPKCVDRWV